MLACLLCLPLSQTYLVGAVEDGPSLLGNTLDDAQRYTVRKGRRRLREPSFTVFSGRGDGLGSGSVSMSGEAPLTSGLSSSLQFPGGPNARNSPGVVSTLLDEPSLRSMTSAASVRSLPIGLLDTDAACGTGQGTGTHGASTSGLCWSPAGSGLAASMVRPMSVGRRTMQSNMSQLSYGDGSLGRAESIVRACSSVGSAMEESELLRGPSAEMGKQLTVKHMGYTSCALCLTQVLVGFS